MVYATHIIIKKLGIHWKINYVLDVETHRSRHRHNIAAVHSMCSGRRRLLCLYNCCVVHEWTAFRARSLDHLTTTTCKYALPRMSWIQLILYNNKVGNKFIWFNDNLLTNGTTHIHLSNMSSLSNYVKLTFILFI